jgi:hypothetical protein
MGFLTTFFNHAQAVQKAAGELGITASTQLADFGLRLELAGRTEVWSARFMARTGGRLAYTDALIPGTIGFAGWTPYAMRRWPVAVDKGAFKQFAFENGIPTPAACLEPSRIGGAFLIKKIDGSFGDGIRGPYLAYDAEDPDQQLQEGEYYENFIVGLIAKAWCWGDRCVAVHLHEPSTVTGDGGSTLRHLVEALPNTRGEHDWDLIVRLAAYCGIAGIEAVPPEGKQVLVEFRYGSRYERESYDNPNVLDKIMGSELLRQFDEAAALLSRAISPDPQLQRSMYTLDAVVNQDRDVQFLEMNCCPLVHPNLYRVMLEDWLPSPRRGEAPGLTAPDVPWNAQQEHGPAEFIADAPASSSA